MAKAYECDSCKQLTKAAQTADVYFPKKIQVNVTFSTAVGNRDLDLCWDCRLELLKFIIKGIEAKQKHTWADVKDVGKMAELL